MARLQLASKSRADFSKSITKKIRREGEIPATVYGHGMDSQAIQVNAVELAELLKTPGGRHSLIDLKVDGKAQKAHPVFIQELQRELVSKVVIHVDFLRVSMDAPVTAQVPLVLLGEAPGAKLGGILELVTSELEVKALPDHIPTHLDVEIGHLELGQSVHCSDLVFPEGIEILSPAADAIIVTVRVPSVHAEVEVVAEAAPAAEAPAE